MFLQSLEINQSMSASEVVLFNYRTADVFRKYDIEYCCTGRWPLETVCVMKGLAFEALKAELQHAAHVIHLPPKLPFDAWDVDFLTRYITHIHHHYLKASLPETAEIIQQFAEGHVKKYPYMLEVFEVFERLRQTIIPHIQYEEETIFPYICQIARASGNNDSYGKLLVKTLRKPLEIMDLEKEIFPELIFKLRALTNVYTPPEKACVNHKVVLSRLKELDNDLMQHIYLEHNILFPTAIKIEQALLQ